MSKNYSLQLPVKPYIKKFLATLEGPEIHWSNQSGFCTMLRAFITNSRSSLWSVAQQETYQATRSASVRIIIPLRKKASIGTVIPSSAVILINSMLEDLFERTLLTYVRTHLQAPGRYCGIAAALESFAAEYDIVLEEDITFEGLKKLEYRARKKGETKKTNLVLSLHSPLRA